MPGRQRIFHKSSFPSPWQAMFQALRLDFSASSSLFSSAFMVALICQVVKATNGSSVLAACSAAMSVYFSASSSCLILKYRMDTLLQMWAIQLSSPYCKAVSSALL